MLKTEVLNTASLLNQVLRESAASHTRCHYFLPSLLGERPGGFSFSQPEYQEVVEVSGFSILFSRDVPIVEEASSKPISQNDSSPETSERQWT